MRSFLCFAILVCLIAGCGRSGADVGPPEGKQAAAPSVTTVKPEKKSLSRVIAQPAHIEAFEETPICSRIGGYVAKVHVDLGDRVEGPDFGSKGTLVRPGKILAELAIPELEEELRQKRALVAQAEAEVEQVKAALEAAEAHVATTKAAVNEAEAGRDRAQANYERWESEHKRVERLGTVLDQGTLGEVLSQFKASAAARKEVDARVRSAEATSKESEAKRNKAKADLTAAKAKVDVARAEQGRVAAMVEYGKIRAPYNGVITQRNIHTGHYLTGNGTHPLFNIARTDIVRVLVDMPESEAVYIKEGVPVKIVCQHIKEQDFEGTVTRISWALDSKARTLRVEIHLQNAHGKLRPGMYAYAHFRPQLAEAFTVPASAVLGQGGDTYLFLVEDGKALRTLVRTGHRDVQVVQILKKRTNQGWDDFNGAEVIVTNPGAVADGQTLVR